MGEYQGYHIVQYALRGPLVMNVLAPVQGKSFLERLLRDSHAKQQVQVILRHAERVAAEGFLWGLNNQTFKPVRALDPSLSVFEFRAGRTVVRIMTYVHNDKARTPVYLFDFKGHQGAQSISPHVREKAERLARIARACMDKEAS